MGPDAAAIIGPGAVPLNGGGGGGIYDPYGGDGGVNNMPSRGGLGAGAANGLDAYDF